MTACNLFVGSRAAYLLADQAGFTADGRLAALSSKPVLSHRLRFAVTTAGESCCFVEDGEVADPLRDLLSDLLEIAETQQEALEALPSVARKAHRRATELADATSPAPSLQLCAALWSAERRCPEGYVVGSPGRFESIPPFTLCKTSGMASPAVDRALWPNGELSPAAARRLIEAQRRTPAADGTFRIGGAAELITVSADGIGAQVVCRWRDRFGERIRPARRWSLGPRQQLQAHQQE